MYVPEAGRLKVDEMVEWKSSLAGLCQLANISSGFDIFSVVVLRMESTSR